MITELFPIVSTRDMEGALGFYRDLLGGVVGYEFRGPDGRLGYVGLDFGSSSLGITLAQEPAGSVGGAISLWVYTGDCDALIERLRSSGVRITEKPADQPWGERMARVLDPDGNEVIVGQRAAPAV